MGSRQILRCQFQRLSTAISTIQSRHSAISRSAVPKASILGERAVMGGKLTTGVKIGVMDMELRGGGEETPSSEEEADQWPLEPDDHRDLEVERKGFQTREVVVAVDMMTEEFQGLGSSFMRRGERTRN